MNRWTAIAVGLAMCLYMVVFSAGRVEGQSSVANDSPIVNATIATISMGTLPTGVGIQGIAPNSDRTRFYVGEGQRTTMWDPSLNRCQGSGSPSPGTGAVGVFDANALARVDDLHLADGFPIHVELDASTGRLYTATSPDWIFAFEGTTQVASSRMGGVPHDIGIDSSNGRGVVTNTAGPSGQVYVTLVDLSTLATIQQTNTGGFGPHKAAGCASIPRPESSGSSSRNKRRSWRSILDIDPVRRRAYVTNQGDNTVSVVDMTMVPAGPSGPSNSVTLQFPGPRSGVADCPRTSRHREAATRLRSRGIHRPAGPA